MMFKNLLIVSLRNIKRNKGYTLLNILGLSLAITISMLSTLRVSNELSYEKEFVDYQRIYRVNQDINISDQQIQAAVTPGAMGPGVFEYFPEIENFVRIDRGNGILQFETKEYEVEGIIKTDSTFFNFFGINIVAGNGSKSIQTIDGVAISSSLARRVFGESNPLGEKIVLNGTIPLIVTCVFYDLPERSHLKVNALVNINKHGHTKALDSWTDSRIFTYIKLKKGVDIEQLERGINEYMSNKTSTMRMESGWRSDFSLINIADIRLMSHRIGDSGSGSISHIITLIAITLIVVILATVNYTNLSVALSSRRAYEVAMRKIAGSSKKYFVYQFLTESVLLSLLAFLFALPLTEIGIKPFGSITGMPMSFSVFSNIGISSIFFLFSIVLGVIAGIYPSLVLSSFDPLKSLRKGTIIKGSNARFRSFLIVSQFTAGLALIIIAIVVFQQRQFLMKSNLGFDKDNTIVIRTQSLDNEDRLVALKNELENVKGVQAVSISEYRPLESFSASNFTPEESSSPMLISSITGDYDITRGLGLNIVQGRTFDSSMGIDSTMVIINQKLANQLGWTSAIGKRIWKGNPSDNRVFTVIGVVEDFHFESMHSSIKPLVIHMEHGQNQVLIVRLDSGNHTNTFEAIKRIWSEFMGEKELKYSYVSESYSKLYHSEESMSKGFILLSVVAIFIACLGLIGLASYTTSMREKEIGIRKVVGASSTRLLLMLCWSFVKLIAIATVISWFIAYILLDDWLNGFAYRTNLSPWVFIVSTIIGIVLAITSVGVVTISTVRKNPSESIQYE